jgi:hypothetical protein
MGVALNVLDRKESVSNLMHHPTPTPALPTRGRMEFIGTVHTLSSSSLVQSDHLICCPPGQFSHMIVAV